MSLGYFSYPLPVNEPVLQYGPGTAEKKRLKEVLAEVRAGRFAEQLSREEAEGYPRLERARSAARETLLEQTRKRLGGED